MAGPRYVGYKRPKNTKKTILHLLSYLGRHKWMFALVALLVFISAGANLMGTYLLKPMINLYIVPGDLGGLLKGVAIMGVMYFCGAMATLGYNQLMVHTSQQVIQEIRQDLFEHVQTLPLKYFDAHTHGELMSRFTNDVDTVQEAMNSSFAMIIQSFMMLFGTVIMMMVLSVRLSMIVVVFLVIMFVCIKVNGSHSRKYFIRQQQEIGKINGFVEEMMAGQKVEKVFNHEHKDYEKFCELSEKLRREGTNALTFSGMMVPTNVSLSFVNYAVSACAGGLFTLSGLMDIGSLSAYLVYVRQSAMPLNQFTQQVNFLLAALSGAERIFEMMEEEPEVDEGRVTLCNAQEKDGRLQETEEETGSFAWKIPDGDGGKLVPLRGDVRFKDLDNDGSITTEDREMIGDPNPDFNFGVNLNLSYKALDFSVSGYGVAGNQIIKSYRVNSVLNTSNYTEDMLGRWHGEGTSNWLPSLNGTATNWQYVSDLYVENGDYFRITNIALGFDFKKVFRHIPLQKLRVYVSGQNLFTFTKYTGLDPEVSAYTGAESWARGIDLGNYPTGYSFMFGVNIHY